MDRNQRRGRGEDSGDGMSNSSGRREGLTGPWGEVQGREVAAGNFGNER